MLLCAYVLTRNLITHDSELAGAIEAELFSTIEMLTIRARRCQKDEVGPAGFRQIRDCPACLRVGPTPIVRNVDS
jgi:hypothetical protein